MTKKWWAVVATRLSPDGRAPTHRSPMGYFGGSTADGSQGKALYVAIIAIQQTTGLIPIYSDNKCVVDGFHKVRSHTIHDANSDLW